MSEPTSKLSSRNSSEPPPEQPRIRPQRNAAIQRSVLEPEQDDQTIYDIGAVDDVTRQAEDDLCLQRAATNARLPFDRLTDQERKLFASFISQEIQIAVFLHIRNTILCQWDSNPYVELSIEDILLTLPEDYKNYYTVTIKIFAYLERYGYINFGIFNYHEPKPSTSLNDSSLNGDLIEYKPLPRVHPKRTEKIVVIGAGMSGLACARQLQHLGFKVTVVEAREEVGGRVYSKEADGAIAELGVDCVEGWVGNPLSTLIMQTGLLHCSLNYGMNIFNREGIMSCPYMESVEMAFRKLVEAAIVLAFEGKFEDMDGIPLNVKNTIRKFIRIKDVDVAHQRLSHQKMIERMVEQLEEQVKALLSAKILMESIGAKLEKAMAELDGPLKEDITLCESNEDLRKNMDVKILKCELNEAVNLFEKIMAERNELKETIRVARKAEPRYEEEEGGARKKFRRDAVDERFLNQRDLDSLNFFIGNLELQLGAPWDEVGIHGLKAMQQHPFGEVNYAVLDGLQEVLKRYADRTPEPLDIQFGQIVRSIHFDVERKEVLVTAEANPSADVAIEPRPLRAAAAVIALPLGCLKKVAEGKHSQIRTVRMEGDYLRVPPIDFHPRLSDEKLAALKRLGTGTVNKVALVFPERFWTSECFVGYLNEKTEKRGEFVLFYSTPNSLIIHALLGGNSAKLIDQKTEKQLTVRAVEILTDIYGNNVPEPDEVFVTRWHDDDLALGAFPIVRPGNSPADYDLMAEPHKDPSASNPHLFFAGDYTTSLYPGKLHGAFLSGLRAAAQIANEWHGSIDSEENHNHYDLIAKMFNERRTAIAKLDETEEICISD